ncbi:MAG: hypothetical protein SVM80_08295 [Halobacteriota archaeon]|nr:hypothetical protein [Halobacteriota archaeon]
MQYELGVLKLWVTGVPISGMKTIVTRVLGSRTSPAAATSMLIRARSPEFIIG